jgi:iron-sulfur cluster repair protein YtfE (RIC family)
MRSTSMPSINAWTRAGVTATVGVVEALHVETAAKVPVINRFMHNQKPPSSQINTFSFFRSRLKKMKQSPV